MWTALKRKIMQFVTILLLFAWLSALPAQAAVTVKPNESVPVQVGLYFGSTAAPTFNLQNVDGYGSGYRLGYFDTNLNFVQLGYTAEIKVSVLKTHNIYLTDTKTYTKERTSNGVVGCYHVELPGSYSDFESAQAVAQQYGGFVAWINGVYCVRVGSYTSAAAASEAAVAYGGTMGETTAYGVSVTVTGTTQILFQFDDCGNGSGLGIVPGMTNDGTATQTWCKGNRYFGAFRYQRVNGGDLTLVNLVNMNDYVNCVISREMSESWPLEALKAQAVCARNYYAVNRGKHNSYGFDICSSVHCQAYSGTSRTGVNTAQAAAETAGQYLWCNGEMVETYYYASNGGASECSENVWSSARSYLRGVADPYEAYVADSISNYKWTYSFSGAELQKKLISSGRTNCGLITSVTLNSTDMGNAYSITFHDANGKDWTIYRESCRTVLGLPSMRFGLGDGPVGVLGEKNKETQVWVNGETVFDSSAGLYMIDGNGNMIAINGSPYVLTSGGLEVLAGETTAVEENRVNTSSGSTFVFSGSGWGHNVGMSQWGANAMAKQGLDYASILTFYYTGVTLG